jgi:segregation and condensation protein B
VSPDDRDILLFPLGIPPDLIAGVEALLFASGDPVPAGQLASALNADPQEVRLALEALRTRCTRPTSGLSLEEVSGGWQLRTSARFAAEVLALRGEKPARLSRAALEVLAIVAYRQPITRHEVERIRGVDSGGIVKALLERGLLRVGGRREEPGRPLEYRTTPAFLELFGLKELAELPSVGEEG